MERGNSDQIINGITSFMGRHFCVQELPHLDDLLFVGNPLYDACELEAWRAEAARRLPALGKLDGETVLREDDKPLTVADVQVTATARSFLHVLESDLTAPYTARSCRFPDGRVSILVEH
ncbi:Dynein light chain 1, axonemal [Eumeta japonica]|uniref:Dynein light chain 1, axonemal n=1 Tax=Eumeta variegata TaxID=151549 RepID=A0A4C1XND2_EUMVA|nr:Dynein light chain 1, axonemal [Eumeta japonica]